MGIVYLAEQLHPIRREVALKIIKPGMDSKRVIARFETEQQALARMEHPNIARVYDAGLAPSGRPYFVMEHVNGLPITEHCDKHRLNIEQRLHLFLHVCQAVQHAHQKGIIHRDLKPSNILVTMQDDKAVPKVIDFGVAKALSRHLAEKTIYTEQGQIIGTPEYMSPEQIDLNDHDIDTRTDVYSLGVLLYELLTGVLPFDRQTFRRTGFEHIRKIICEQDPKTPSTRLSRTSTEQTSKLAQKRRSEVGTLQRKLRGDLDWITLKAMEKNRSRRYTGVDAMAADIHRHLRNQPILAGSPGTVYRLHKFWKRHRGPIVVTAAAALFIAATLASVMTYLRNSKVQWAKTEALPRINKLIRQDRYLDAFSLAQQAQTHISQDPMLIDLWPRIARNYSVTTAPTGANVFFKEYLDIEGKWRKLGRSPIENIRFPRGVYRWKIEKQGFVTKECVAGEHLDYKRVVEDTLHIVLHPKETAPPEMVHIPAGNSKVHSRRAPQQIGHSHQIAAVKVVAVPAYWIDKYELTNEQYKDFVDAGGYRSRKYWRHNFIEDGRTLSWQQAMNRFRDKTGRPGPSTWENGAYPETQDKHPVCGISWYEAAAYAEFAAKNLPAVYHWSAAASIHEAVAITPLSNFKPNGPAPVGTNPGMGRTGLYDMAGNVKEWCFNAADESGSRRYILGGAWGEQSYQFVNLDSRSPWDRAQVNGFRCVKYPHGEQEIPHALFDPIVRSLERDYAAETPVSDEEFRFYKRLFTYDRTELNSVVESVDDTSRYWRTEKITFDAAYGGERVIAYLFIPKGFDPPYQTVIWFPGAAAVRHSAFENLSSIDFTEFVILSGRALLYPVYKGTFERQLPSGPPHALSKPVAFREWIIHLYKDLGRSIDYLRTRNDIDSEKIAYYGMSWGARLGPVMLAVEDRFKLGILVVGGFPAEKEPLAVDPLNYAPRVKTPVVMINGGEDFVFPLESSQTPLFESLGTPHRHKQHIIYPGGHGLLGLFTRQIKKDVLAWLDRYLGPVD
jgi:serine/threonine protein kinase/formylglycine-generating enzyme required for sulfatase activity/dienelactone hydrolase